MGRPPGRWFPAALVLLLAAIAGLALEVRWSRAAREDGPALRPRPDAVEYAAGAQAIVQAGRYYLQVGPYRVRPRYAPGWPLLLAGALAAGVEPAELWRVAAGFDAGLACLLAVGVTLAVRRLAFDRARAAPGRLAAAALGAGLFAGACWALAPLAVEVSTVALSDAPAAFASALCLACAIFVRARAEAVRPAHRAKTTVRPAHRAKTVRPARLAA